MQNYTTIIGVIKKRTAKAPYRDVTARYQIGNSTVHLIMERYETLGISLETLESMKPEDVEKAFYPSDVIRRNDTPLPDFQKIHDRIHEKGSKANLYFLWERYKGENPEGYQYTQFAEYYNRWQTENYGSKNVAMAVERIPGEKMYIDWVGDTPYLIHDPSTGEVFKVHTFVTTLGVSSKVYAELFPNEKEANFIAGTVHAVESYGAIPKYFVPDNAKTAVIKHTKDELVINSAYEDLESYYDVIILPPPARKPTGKPTVERYVQYLETKLLETLKEYTFTSFEQANEETKKIVAAINDEIPQGWNMSHNDAFEAYDKPKMKLLSYGSFTLCDYVAFDSVPRNYHLKYDGHYYSVFYTYYGQPVILKATATDIKICDKNNRLICTHKRSYAKFPLYVTKDEHMPAPHRFYKEVNGHDGDYYRRWAKAMGESMYIMVDRVLCSSKHEEQSYNSCNGILHMCDGVSKMIANEAAKRCIEMNVCKYSYFKKILAEVKKEKDDDGSDLPNNENVWGDDYYE